MRVANTTTVPTVLAGVLIAAGETADVPDGHVEVTEALAAGLIEELTPAPASAVAEVEPEQPAEPDTTAGRSRNRS